MNNYIGFLDGTLKKSVTNTNGSYTVPDADNKRFRYAVTADADVFLDRNVAATTSSFYLPAKTTIILEFFGADTINYITASTANLYLTKVE